MNNTQKALKFGLKYGTVAGLLMVLNVYILTAFGLGLSYWVFIINIIILLIVVYKAHQNFKQKNDGILNVKTALVINLIIALLSMFIQQLNMVIYIAIDPSWIDMVEDIRRKSMIENGLSEVEIKQKLRQFKKLFTPLRMLTRGVLVPGTYFFFFSSIIIFFTKSKSSKISK